MNEFRMDMALEEMPVSGCTCLSTYATRETGQLEHVSRNAFRKTQGTVGKPCIALYLVDVNLVALHGFLGALLPACAGLLGDGLLGRLTRLLFCFRCHCERRKTEQVTS